MLRTGYLVALLRDAGIPVHGCAFVTATQVAQNHHWHVVDRGAGVLVRIDYNGATGAQITQGNGIVQAADFDPATISAYEESLKPERKALRDAATQALADNQNYLAISSPTAAQVRVQTQALTQQVNALIRRLVQLD